MTSKAALRGALQRALEHDERSAHRLSNAGTSVTFDVVDDESVAITLLLDREPPAISDDRGAEITITLHEGQAELFARGDLVVANCLMTGSIDYQGPVRKYLAVDPVLRHLLRQVSVRGEEHDGAS